MQQTSRTIFERLLRQWHSKWKLKILCIIVILCGNHDETSKTLRSEELKKMEMAQFETRKIQTKRTNERCGKYLFSGRCGGGGFGMHAFWIEKQRKSFCGAHIHIHYHWFYPPSFVSGFFCLSVSQTRLAHVTIESWWGWKTISMFNMQNLFARITRVWNFLQRILHTMCTRDTCHLRCHTHTHTRTQRTDDEWKKLNKFCYVDNVKLMSAKDPHTHTHTQQTIQTICKWI